MCFKTIRLIIILVYFHGSETNNINYNFVCEINSTVLSLKIFDSTRCFIYNMTYNHYSKYYSFNSDTLYFCTRNILFNNVNNLTILTGCARNRMNM